MTVREMRALLEGALLQMVEPVCGLPARSIFIKVRVDDEDYVTVYGPLQSEAQAEYDGLSCGRFKPYTLAMETVVRNLTPEISEQLQRRAFSCGYEWSDGDVGVSNTNEETLTFFPYDKNICYGNDAEYEGKVNLDASIPLHVTAVTLALGAGPSQIPMTLEQLVGEEVASLIRNSPTSPTLRGMIRATTLKVVPVETMGAGTEAITAWILENVKTPVHPSKLEIPVPPAPAFPNRRNVGPTRRVTYNYSETELGTCRYSVTRSSSGSIDVPETVIAEGEEAVDDWIKEHVDLECDDDYEYNDHESQDSDDHNFDSNSGAVCEEYAEEHPEAAANE